MTRSLRRSLVELITQWKSNGLECVAFSYRPLDRQQQIQCLHSLDEHSVFAVDPELVVIPAGSPFATASESIEQHEEPISNNQSLSEQKQEFHSHTSPMLEELWDTHPFLNDLSPQDATGYQQQFCNLHELVDARSRQQNGSKHHPVTPLNSHGTGFRIIRNSVGTTSIICPKSSAQHLLTPAIQTWHPISIFPGPRSSIGSAPVVQVCSVFAGTDLDSTASTDPSSSHGTDEINKGQTQNNLVPLFSMNNSFFINYNNMARPIVPLSPSISHTPVNIPSVFVQETSPLDSNVQSSNTSQPCIPNEVAHKAMSAGLTTSRHETEMNINGTTELDSPNLSQPLHPPASSRFSLIIPLRAPASIPSTGPSSAPSRVPSSIHSCAPALQTVPSSQSFHNMARLPHCASPPLQHSIHSSPQSLRSCDLLTRRRFRLPNSSDVNAFLSIPPPQTVSLQCPLLERQQHLHVTSDGKLHPCYSSIHSPGVESKGAEETTEADLLRSQKFVDSGVLMRRLINKQIFLGMVALKLSTPPELATRVASFHEVRFVQPYNITLIFSLFQPFQLSTEVLSIRPESVSSTCRVRTV